MTDYFCIIAVILYTVHGAPTDLFHSTQNCGYESCNPVKDGMINVHLVPHTHDDVGWLKTVDQYYYGDQNDIALAGVQYILDSVIPQLISDPSKRFIYVEIAFFARWWREQTDSMRHIVKGLVAEGRLEFILGGWSMNDEATTHYNAIIDQHTLGFDFLRQNFKDCGRPRVAWQIDTFGHSREQASLFAQMGFDGLFFGRLDFQDQANRLKKKTMEMIWKGSPKNLGQTSELFTGALYNQYGPPAGFCWDFDHCDSSPIMDDEHLHDYNVPTVLADLFKAVNDQAVHYQTKHIIWTMGSDFQYDNANVWYKNMDKLIKYANALQANGSNINLLYSTPSCYLDQLNKAGLKWTTKEDDFFPYSNDPHSVWTGFLTSRPTLKYYVRRTNNFLQVTKQMDALAMLEDTDNSTYNINILKEAMGVAQHHDAVSGTEKQPVAYDYATRLANGVNECQKVINDAYGKLMPLGSQKPPSHQFCNLLNISSCAVTENNKMLYIYNPIARSVEYYVKLPVVGQTYSVIGPDGTAIETQVLPISPDTMRIPERNGSLATNELIFPTTLQPLGFTTYFIQMKADKKTKPNHATKIKHLSKSGDSDDIVLENLFISLTFDHQTGRLKNMKNKRKNISINMTQEFRFYYGFDGNDSRDELQPSNSYIFRPNGTQTYNCSTPSLTTKTYYTEPGELVQELHQTFSPWVTQTVILNENARFAEFQWTVGPIPIDDKLGKEVISKFTTDLKNQGFFYTDANGREILERRLNHRDTWALNLSEPIAGNYYPINSRIFIQDQIANVQLTILNDRSQGGASIQDGEIEIMVHRRLLNTVSLGEALNETGSDGKGLVVRGSHYVFLDTVEASAALHREKAEELFMAPQLSFTIEQTKYSDWSKNFRTMWSGVKQALPPNVHLLTLEQFAGTGPAPSQSQPYLLRLEHMYETDEDATLSKPVNVSLQGLFTTFEITSATELTLGANLPLSQLERLKWMSADGLDTESTDDQDSYLKYQGLKLHDSLTVTLTPMQIKTFQIEIKSRQQFKKTKHDSI